MRSWIVISCLYSHMQHSSPLSMLVRAVLLDKKAEEVPSVSINVSGAILFTKELPGESL